MCEINYSAMLEERGDLGDCLSNMAGMPQYLKGSERHRAGKCRYEILCEILAGRNLLTDS